MQEDKRGKKRRRQDPGADKNDKTITELRASFI